MSDFKGLVEQISIELKNRGMMIATAESCTGGMVAAAITARPGSSSVFDRGFVAYSYESKEELLNVSREILEKHGAVSPECAVAMAHGALDRSWADLAISITGIAGPDGGMEGKPVGLVYIGYGLRDGPVKVQEHHFSGDRDLVREQTVTAALTLALTTLKGL
jgi:nicotinamide-nucleotide amidase